MSEPLKLTDFDILGIIKLRDVKGIEKYVTKIQKTNAESEQTEYFSRSKEYYNVKSLSELSNEREELKRLLTREYGKRNFVILENMLNCSARSYFKKFEEYILSGQNENSRIQMDMARKCMEEDTRNILVLLANNGLISVNPKLVLPQSDENCQKRAIEMDNKAVLYIFSKALELDNKELSNIEVLTPGYGSIYIGPFLKEMYGVDYTNIFKSKYISESSRIVDAESPKQLVSNQRIFNNNSKVILLDDNVGTGDTMQELKETLSKSGINVVASGAVQYNWRNYYKVSVGKKEGINRFDTSKFDFINPINYAGHKLYSHAIDLLHSSGEEYENYLNSKSYRLENCCDIEGAVLRGIICAKRTGLNLCKASESISEQDEVMLPEYQNVLARINVSSQSITDKIVKQVEELILKDAEKDIGILEEI